MIFRSSAPNVQPRLPQQRPLGIAPPVGARRWFAATLSAAALSAAALSAAALSAAALFTAAALSGCTLWGADGVTASLDAEGRTKRIEVLRGAIDLDHARLEDLVTEAGPQGSNRLQENPEVRAIAARLEAHQNELLEIRSTP